jgi:phage tail-like protein
MPTMSPQTKLGMAMRFEVTIDDMPLGGWSRCQGLDVEFTYLPYREGGTNSHRPLLPDCVQYGEITLARAVNAQDSAQVMRWLSRKAQQFTPGTGVIKLFDAHQGEVASWSLRNVCPRRWSGPTLSSDLGAGIAIESLVLAHEGFLGE